MKKLIFILSAVFMIASLSACASSMNGGDDIKVKCPACGYEFSLDSADTGR